MNSRHILYWLLQDAKKHASDYYSREYYPYDADYTIGDLLLELNSRRPLNLSEEFYNLFKRHDPDDKNKVVNDSKLQEKIVAYLLKTFKNNISFVSLSLSLLYPDHYVFYRVSMLEDEIFRGFKFFSDIVEEFDFSFSKIGKGKDSFENYVRLNGALHSFAEKAWPDLKNPKILQKRIHYFLYQGLGNLFL